MDPIDLVALIRNMTGGGNRFPPEVQPIPNYQMGGMASANAAPAEQSPSGPPPYYLAAPNAPLSYMMPGSPLNAPDPNQAAAERVNSLINGMETQPGPAAPMHRSAGNKILGALGDALSNYGSVRSGGPVQPMGQYGSGVQQELLRFQNASDEAAKNNAAIRNQMRLAAFQSEQDRITAKEVAGIRASGFNRSMRPLMESGAIDIDGAPTQVTLMRDPVTRETVDVQIGGQSVMDDERIMEQIHRGIKGFAPVYMPGQAPDAKGNMQASIFGIDRATGHFKRLGIQPVPPEGFVKDMGGQESVLTGMPKVMEAFNTANDDATKETWMPGFLQKWKNWGESYAANTQMKDLLASPKMIDYYDQARGILIPYIRAVSGLTVPEAEYRRYENRLPIPGVTRPENVIGRWNSIVREMLRDMDAKYRVSGRQSPPRLTEILQRIDQQMPDGVLLGMDASGNPEGVTPDNSIDEAEFFKQLDARRKASANAPAP